MNNKGELDNLESIWRTIRETIHDIEKGGVELHPETIRRLSGTCETTRHWPTTETGNWLKGLSDMYFDNVRFELNYSSNDKFTIVLIFLKNNLAVEKLKFGNIILPRDNGTPARMGFSMGEHRQQYRGLKEIRREIVCLTAYAAIKQVDRKSAGEMFCDVIRLEPEANARLTDVCAERPLN